MAQIVIMPGGFHPFHAGHLALYNSARQAFPDADVYVAATADTSTRPFPFSVKQQLARLAGVPVDRFVQVKSPFRAQEITSQYNPDQDVLIFVRSEKDKNNQPRPGGNKKDGSPSYLQPLGSELEPFGRHAYMAYLPTVEFGPGITSASEIRAAWPQLTAARKRAMVKSLYPRTQKNSQLASVVVNLLDQAIEPKVTETAKIIHPQLVDIFVSAGYDKPPLMVASKIPYKLFDLYVEKVVSKYPQYKPTDFSFKASGINEGEVIPFGRRPVPPLRWQDVPQDILLLANDWFWASEDNSGLDAVMDPQGYGSGTANDVRYITAKLQQKGWTIDFNDEHDAPGEFNLRLTNRRGQTVLLSIPDAQSFRGWAQGTNTGMQENLGQMAGTPAVGGMTASYQRRENQPIDEDYIDEKWSAKYKQSINCARPRGFSQRAHCAGRKK